MKREMPRSLVPFVLVPFVLVPFVLVLLVAFVAAVPAALISYRVQPEESTITYYMDHPMHSWSGTSRKATGTVVVDADGRPVRVQLQAPVLSFDSGNKSRDSHMAETVEFYAFPDVTFESTEITPGDADDEGRPTWDVKGNLTFHGVTRPVESLVHVSLDDASMRAEGAFDLVLTDYAIELPSLLSIKVKDWMKLEFDIRAAASETSSGHEG